MADPWQFEKVTLPNGLRMRIARAGSGPLMVMLHGFPECWYSWRHQLRAFAPNFTCVAPEMRGYGETDAPVGVANYKGELLVDDVAGLIATLGYQRAIVVGHDWGGGIAWSTALMRPDVVERLIVMNCPHPAVFMKHLRSDPWQLMRSWYMFFFQLPWLPEMILRAGDFAILRRGMRDSAVNKEAFSDADFEYFRKAFDNPYSVSAAINYYRAMFREGLRGGAPPWAGRKIAAPTILIWGEQDVALRKELTYGMDDLFSGAFTLRYIPDSGHWVQQERPELVNQHMREFLADLIHPDDASSAARSR